MSNGPNPIAVFLFFTMVGSMLAAIVLIVHAIVRLIIRTGIKIERKLTGKPPIYKPKLYDPSDPYDISDMD